jgi:hypothetical protein
VKPLVIDLYSGLHGWCEGFLPEGYRCIAFDLFDMCDLLGVRRPKGIRLVLRDVCTLTGAALIAEYGIPAVIVASPPCQKYSYMAMPWKRAKEMIRYYESSAERRAELTLLFDTCFRLQREASEAAGRYIPLIVENVRGAQKWVGQAMWHFGSYYLWGDVPALMPITLSAKLKYGKVCFSPAEWELVRGGDKTINHPNKRAGLKAAQDGQGGYGGNFGWDGTPLRRGNSKSDSRKAASALIAKIPFPLAQHIARTFLQVSQ